MLSVRCFQYGSKDTLLDKAAYIFLHNAVCASAEKSCLFFCW